MKHSHSSAKHNGLNVVIIFVIIILTVAIGMMFLELNHQMSANVDCVQSQSNMQDFSFFLTLTQEDYANAQSEDYETVLQNKAQQLAAKYDFSFELHPYKIVKSDDSIFRVYPDGRTIDKLLCVDGAESASQAGVLLDYNYASYHELGVGDSIQVNGEKFRVDGVALFPDKLSPIVDNTGIPYSRKDQAILTLNDVVYQHLDGNLGYELVAIAGKDFDSTRFQEDSAVAMFTESSENPQIMQNLESKSSMNKIVLYFSMVLLFSIVALLLIVMIINSIDDEVQRIGVLKALGFNNFEITRKYLKIFWYILLPSTAGYLLGYALLPTFGQIMMSDLAIPISRKDISILVCILLLAVPSLVFTALSYFVARAKVQKNAIELMRSKGKQKENWVIRRINKRIQTQPYLKGVRRTVLYANMLVLFFVVFGGFAIGVQVQFAFTMYNMTSRLSSQIMDGVNYDSSVRLSQAKGGGEFDAADLPYYCQSMQIETGDDQCGTIELIVLSDQNEDLLTFKDKSGKKIDNPQQDGVIINDWLSLHYNLKKGDTIELKVGSEQRVVQVAEISNAIYGKAIYTNMAYAQQQNLAEADTYNAFFTNRAISFDSSEHLSVTSSKAVRDSINASSDVYTFLSVFFLVTGIVIGTAMLILSMSTVVSKYKKYISLLKIMGYNEKECGNIVKGFRTASMVGYLISIPYAFGLCTLLFSIISRYSDVVYRAQFDPISVVGCLIVTFAITQLSLVAFIRKIHNISFRMVLES